MEIVVKATKEQVNTFKESLLWGDIVAEVLEWKIGCLNELLSIPEVAPDENPSSATVLMHLGNVHGRIKSINYFTGILDTLLSKLEAQNDRPDKTE